MTVQGCETLIYNGDEYRTNSEPLKQYLEIKNITFEDKIKGVFVNSFKNLIK